MVNLLQQMINSLFFIFMIQSHANGKVSNLPKKYYNTFGRDMTVFEVKQLHDSQSNMDKLNPRNRGLKVNSSCVDSFTYRNPLNELLTCSHHKGLQCEKWATFGLNETEIDSLLSNCPVSCNSPCSVTMHPSVAPLDFELSFYIHNIDSFIDDQDVKKLQVASKQYLSSYLTNSKGFNATSLISFTIVSQQFVNKRMLRGRQLEGFRKTLQINSRVIFELNTKREDLIRIDLMDGIQSSGFLDLLKYEIDVAGISISSFSQSLRPPTYSTAVNSNAGTIVGITVILLVSSFIIAAVLIHRRRSKLRPFLTLSPNNSCENTPQSPQARIDKFTLRVDECELRKFAKVDASNPENKTISTDLIPPMIVIDNIDGNIPESLQVNHSKKEAKATINSRENDLMMKVPNIRASTKLDTSLELESNFIQNKLILNRCNPYAFSNTGSEKDDRSPLSLISSRPSIGETISAASTPASNVLNQENGENISPQRKSVFSFDPNIDMEPEDDFTVLFEKKMKEGGKRSFNLKDLFKRHKTLDDEHSSGNMSHCESESELSEMSPVMRAKDSMIDILPTNSPPIKSLLNEAEAEKDFKMTAQISQQYDHELPDLENDHRDGTIASPAQHIYSFEAPTNGKLGLVIQSKSEQDDDDSSRNINGQQYCGAIIRNIKGYSPLLGMMQPGDIILSIDGINTINMSAQNVTSLLAKKNVEQGDNEEKMKVIVWSNEEKIGYECESLLSLRDFQNAVQPSDPINNDGDHICPQTSFESDSSLHLIGKGTYNDDDSFHMMTGAEDFM